MTTYQLPRAGASGIIVDGATFVPADEGLSAWRRYQEWVAGGGVPLPASVEPIADARARGVRSMRDSAESLRRDVYPIEPGAAYALAQLEAEAAVADEDVVITGGEYPLLEALVPSRGATVALVADAILADRTARRAWLAQVEGALAAGEVAVAAAGTSAAVDLAVAAVDWPALP